MRRFALTALASAALVLTACDSGPSGPGTLSAVASAPSLGGVLLEVQGRGIRSFTARGSSRVYSAAVPGRADTHRVIVISPQSGDLAFDIEVDDRGMEGPTVVVIQAADETNQAIPRSGVAVRIER